jgi:hypothetical protein
MSRTLFALCLVTLPVLAAPKLKPPTYYHPTRVGDRREYEETGGRLGDQAITFTEVVTKVEDRDGRLLVSMNMDKDGKSWWVHPFEVWTDGVYRSRTRGTEAIPVLKLPVKAGSTWSARIGPATGKGFLYTYTVRAVDEEIEVPAGKFKAICVEEATKLGDEDMSKTTSWYAPEVGLVKSVLSYSGGKVKDRVQVLKAFKRGRE